MSRRIENFGQQDEPQQRTKLLKLKKKRPAKLMPLANPPETSPEPLPFEPPTESERLLQVERDSIKRAFEDKVDDIAADQFTYDRRIEQLQDMDSEYEATLRDFLKEQAVRNDEVQFKNTQLSAKAQAQASV
jgi:hypothetical protein